VSTLVLPLIVWTTVVATVVVVDLTAYFVAAARAQQMADSAALAALSTDVRGPRAVAAALAAAGGGSLVACDCPDGAGRAEVVVSVPVPGLVVPLLGAGRVEATAGAELVRPRGPT
jgi:peptidoglycan/LPS O-acetylase OafA/YrhL